MPRLGCGPVRGGRTPGRSWRSALRREPSWPRGLTELGVCAACHHLPVGRLQLSETR